MYLEQLAIQWADRCDFTPPCKTLFPQYRDVGINIAVFSKVQRNVSVMANRWYKESEYYHYDTDSCDYGRTCGHYKQVSC